jgi:DNA-binding CsgD family transcriptional regulator
MSDDLTAKQHEVYAHLSAGHTVAEAAKAMQITPSGVYTHIRRLRERGVVIPTEAVPATNGTGKNGVVLAANGTYTSDTPEAVLRDAVEELERTGADILVEIEEKQRLIHDTEIEIENLQAAMTTQQDQNQRYREALEILEAL